jgi:hypothetical protein
MTCLRAMIHASPIFAIGVFALTRDAIHVASLTRPYLDHDLLTYSLNESIRRSRAISDPTKFLPQIRLFVRCAKAGMRLASGTAGADHRKGGVGENVGR